DRLVIEAGPAALEEFRSGLALAFPEGDEGQTVPDGSGRLLVEAGGPPVAGLIGRRTENVIGQGGMAGPPLGVQREGQTVRDEPARPGGSGRLVVEAVVPPVSRLIGRRTENVIGQGRIAGTLLGIQREGQTLRDKLGAKRIRSGDVLLILMPEPNMADIDP